MKKTQIKRREAFKLAAIFVLIAAILCLYLPFGSIVPRAQAETVQEQTTEQVVKSQKAVTREASTVSELEVTIYYFRGNKDYKTWYLWLWLTNADGEDVKFDETETINGYECGKVTKTYTADDDKTLDVDSDGNVLGFIVKDSSWNKDPDGNRYVTLSDITDGKATIYLVSGTEEVYYEEEDALGAMEEATKNKILSAYFKDFDTVHIVTETTITSNSYFVIRDQDGNSIGEVDCATATLNGKSMDITVAGIDFSKTYTIYDEPAAENDKNFAKHKVLMNRLFESEVFNDEYEYTGTLGAEYTKEQTKFTVWSPYASEMKLNIYDKGEGGAATSYKMTAGANGTWSYTLKGDQNGKYYTYSVVNGDRSTEVVDPYARSGGRNGQRGMILDLASTNPDGWETQNMPELKSNTHAVIWEAQLRDVTINPNSGVSEKNRGKFLGLTETGTKTKSGKSTGLDYLKALGITQVHFQPLFDFASVNENFTTATYNAEGQFNWGYDPLNYNMPEGSYSSDPADGFTRVNEMKQMIMALHNAGIQVVMDVVYNHVSDASTSNFEKLMPGYYFRMNETGAFYNGSGCGNETASEHAMFRKFMIDSVLYWTKEYKIDGFRFDLMGLHDIETMNKLYDELVKINPDVIVYGEGWTGGTSGLADNRQAKLDNAKQTPHIAYFDDVIRDGLKGSYNSLRDTGFVSGKKGQDSAVYVGARGATKHFAANPTQNINYVDCHDNSTIWDKLNASVKADKSTLMAMNRLAAASVMTSQGIGFMLAGEEMLRSKPTTKKNDYDNRPNVYRNDSSYYFADNSYRSPDSVNAIDWDLLDTNEEMVEFYKGLIAIKTTWPQFQLDTKEQIDANVIIKDDEHSDGIAVYAVKDPSSNQYAVVILNSTENASAVSVPQGKYDVFVNGNKASAKKLSSFSGSSFTVGARSAVVMRGELKESAVSGWTYKIGAPEDGDGNLGLALGLGIGIPAVVLIAGGTVFGVMKSKKKKSKTDKSDDNADEGGEQNDTETTPEQAESESPDGGEQDA